MNMANRIQYLRKTKGMSQEEVAENPGISRLSLNGRVSKVHQTWKRLLL